MTFTTLAFCVLFFLAMQAFFSGSEIAMVSIDKGVLRHKAARGSRGARLALTMLDRPDWMLSTTLVGTNIATVTNSTIATAFAIKQFGEAGALYAVLIMIPLIWLFAEIIPKSVFQQKAQQIVPKVIYGLWLFSILLSPIIFLFSRISKFINRNAPDAASPFIQRQEFIAMVNTPELVEGDIDEIEKDMIQRVFHYSETTAQQAMTPLSEVFSLASSSSVGEAMQLALQCGHARLPMHDDSKENMVGLVNTLEMLGEDPRQSAGEFMRPIQTTKADTSVATLFSDLRQSKAQLAIVLDQLDKAIGLISTEDIMEEVVADFEDEHDKLPSYSNMVKKLGARNFMVNAHITPDQLDDALGIALPSEDYASLSDYLLEQFGHIPKPGQHRQFSDYLFKVKSANSHGVLKVQVTW